jgi:uncharacterized membrane protein YdbT with pleckstrin-like domain
MTTNNVSDKEKKLKNLRKILWFCFSGVSILSILIGTAILLANTVNTNPPVQIQIYIAIIFLVLITVSAIVCLVIYFIYKHRLENDDELFL